MATERELLLKLRLDNQASAELGKVGKALGDIGEKAEDAGRRASQSFGEFRTSFNSAFGDFGKSIDSVDSLKSTLGSLAGSFAATGIKEAAEFVKDSVVNFAEYERALVDVARTTGYSKEQTAALGESLRDLGANELQGQVVASDLAKIAEAAGQLGITSQTDILAFTRSVAEVSSATGLSAEETADSLSKIASVFQESLEKPRIVVNEFGQAITKDFGSAYTQIGNVGSAFDYLADTTNGTIEGIMNRVQRMGGMATTIGLTVDQTASLAAIMESAGLSAEKGSTAANKFMSELLTNSDNFAKALDLNGKALKDAIAKDPMEGILMVLEGMGKLKQEKGPEELIVTMQQLLGKGDGIKEFATKMSGATEELRTASEGAVTALNDGTRATDSFLKAADTTLGGWSRIKFGIDSVSLSLGQQLKPAVDGASGVLADFTANVAGAFRKDSVDSFFDGVVSGFAELGSANLTEWLKAIPTAAAQTVVDLNPVLNGGVTTLMGGIAEMVGAGDWFAGMLTNANQILGETKAVFAESFASMKAEAVGVVEEIKYALSDAKPAPLTFDAQGALDELQQLRTSIGGFTADQADLQAQYKVVWQGMQAAIADNREPSEQLIQRMQTLKEEIKAVGVEAYGSSTFPDMTAAIDTSSGATTNLTAQMESVRVSVKQLEADYKAANQSEDAASAQKKANLQAIDEQIRALKVQQDNAWGSRREQLDEEITALKRQKETASDVSTSRKGDLDAIKQKLDAEKDKLKELEQAQKEIEKAEKARADAIEILAKNTERTAELRQQQLADEQQAENELYQQRQEQAADSIRWIDDLGEASKKRLLGEQDAVEILEAQGVVLTDIQEQEVRRMQGAYKTEEAYKAQAEALEKQLGTSVTLAELGGKLSESLGGLSGGIGKIGDLFGADTSGITNVIGKVQELAELPQTIADMKEAIGGIGEAFGSLKDLGGLKDLLKGGGGGLSGLLSSLGSIAPIAGIIMSAWGPIKDFFGSLFEDTKSKGTEAAEAMQSFLTKNVEGGAAMADAAKAGMAAMTAANFDYQAALESTGSTMSQVMGGISTNWQQGATAMDVFTVAVGKATGDMQKAPQVALEMMIGFDKMGLSAEQAGAEMVKIAEAAGLSDSQLQQLQGALGGATASAQDFAATSAETAEVVKSSASSTTEMTNSLLTISGSYASAADAARSYAQAAAQAAITRSMSGLSVPAAAMGAESIGGIVQVGERGAEIADYSKTGGGWEMIGQRGPEFRMFPDRTRIVPHHRLQSFLADMRQTNVPGAASGGTVHVNQQKSGREVTNQIIINAAMLNEQTVREADLRLKRLQRRRVTV